MTKHAVEESKVDQLYDILMNSKEPKTFYEMIDQVYKKGEIEADGGESLARLYTTLALDGRFISLSNNLWALRDWFPVDQRESDVAKTLGRGDGPDKSKIDDDGFDDYDDIDEEELEDEDLDDSETDTPEDDEEVEDDYGDHDDEDDSVNRIKRRADLDDDDE